MTTTRSRAGRCVLAAGGDEGTDEETGVGGEDHGAELDELMAARPDLGEYVM